VRSYRRLIMAASVAACLLAALAANASATRALGIEPAGPITMMSEGNVTIRVGVFREVICRLGLTGQITAREVAKASARRLVEGRIGQIEGGGAGECTESERGAAEVLVLAERNTPYPLRYDAFLGTLPDISGILVTSLFSGIRITAFMGLRCLYQGELGLLVTFPPSEDGMARRFNRVRFLETTRLRTTDIGCPTEATFRGELKLMPPQTLTLR